MNEKGENSRSFWSVMLVIMCGRFYDLFDLDDITTRFRIERFPRDPLPLRYNVTVV